jgi:protein TonB
MRPYFDTALPIVGSRSRVGAAYNGNLRRAFYSTHALLFFAIVLAFSYVRYEHWRAEVAANSGNRPKPPVIIIDPTRLGPPPSIIGGDGDHGLGTNGVGNNLTAPAVGVPRPVPDDRAIQLTSPTQQDIAGTGLFDGKNGGVGDSVVVAVTDIPPIDAFVPFEKPPQIIAKPSIEYPPISVALDEQGTAYVKALVDLDGSIMRVVVVRSSGSARLDSAAANNVGGWKMKPAIQNDKPVRVWVASPITFRLGK